MRLALTIFILSFFQIIALCQSGKMMRLLKKGKFQEAIDYTIEKVDKTKNPIRYHQGLARAYALIGNDIRAEKEFKKALIHVDKKSKKELRLRDFDVMDELALLSVRIGNWQQARKLISRSLQLRVKWWRKNDPVNFRPYLPLGMMHFHNGSIDSAKYYFNRFKDNIRFSNYTSHLDVDQYADVFLVLADIALNENDLQTSLRLAKKSSRLQRHAWTKREAGKNYADRIRALNKLSSIHIAMNNYKKAEKLITQKDKMLRHIQGNLPLKIDASLISSRLKYHSGNFTECKDLVSKAMQLQMEFVNSTFIYLSEYEKENIYAQFRSNSERIYSLVYDLYKNEYASEVDSLLTHTLNYVINTKAVILSENNKIRRGIINSQDDSLPNLLEKWKQLKKQWQYLSSAAKKKSSDRLDNLQAQIVKIEKELGDKFNSRSTISWVSIKDNLKDHEMAVEMVQVPRPGSESAFMIFKIKNNSDLPQISEVKLEKGAENQIKYYFNAIKFDVSDTLSFPLIWKPMGVPADVKKVYVSPSGIFHLVNFNVLKTSEGDYLVDNQNIVNITNIGNLANAQPKEGIYQSAVLAGVSDFEKWRVKNNTFRSVENLPGVAAEIDQLDSLLKRSGVSTTTVLNERVTENLFDELESPSLLHLASHGFYKVYNNNAMLGSGLLLNQTDSLEDGFLTAYEASLLDLNETELVVLSACNSGLGEVLEGEGVYGLQRAFESAGADHIIMSLWKIDDAFTQYFMHTFYSNLMIVKDVSVAFNQTLIQAKKQNENPRLWGAFKLVMCY